MSPNLPMMSAVILVLLTCHAVQSQDDDDEVKGPIMPMKKDGSMLTTSENIIERKHKAETHNVTTEDGYILTVFRVVPAVKPLAVVLLQHGYLASSDCWVTDPDSLAFKLSDAGYDVWISNIRGNAYNKRHSKLKSTDKEFWNFSWHEMGTKDMPAVIDYALKTTGQKQLHYIGHSMGTTMSYVMTSLLPAYNKKLLSLVSLSPVVYLNKLMEMIGPDGMVEAMATKMMGEFKKSGKVEVFPRKDQATDSKMQLSCADMAEDFQDMCTDKMEEAQGVLGGPYLPAGSSYKTMDHFHQFAVAGVMRHYKYDSDAENQKAYGSAEPPKYPDKFKQITAPTLLWSAEGDQLVTFQDVDDLVAVLPNMVADNRIKDECFDHISFLFPRLKSCIPVRAKLYKDIIEAITKLNKK